MELSPATVETGMPFLVAAELQDNLLRVDNDLARLQTLLSDACDTMLAGFCGASSELRAIDQSAEGQTPGDLQRAIDHLSQAVVALQFQDMATQLIAHTHQRLRHCTDRLAREAIADDDDDESVVAAAPTRPNPVTQDEMDAGSIDLF